ncbi:hypothetical protein K4F52_005597 [Lecanicillium sp. MT-2017a]|nr:hypothetical protein K4F52_005597 [Lecanicillium sp. MT-2017a]
MESINKSNIDVSHHGGKGAAAPPNLPPLLQGMAEEERRQLERRLVSVLDIRLMPMLVLIYIMNYLDRNAIAAARLAGLVEELGLSSVQYQNWKTSHVSSNMHDRVEWESVDHSLMHGVKECVRDSKTWYLVVLVLGAVSSGTINNFFPSVVQTLGKGRIETLLLTSPPYLLSCIVAMAVSRNSDRVQERYFHFSIPLWISVAGFIISAATTQLASRHHLGGEYASYPAR